MKIVARTDPIRVAHASRVLAKTSRLRALVHLFWKRRKTPNAQRSTPNAQWQKGFKLDVERWTLSVGRCFCLYRTNTVPVHGFPQAAPGQVDDFLYSAILTLTLTY
jgi:hypothetical protein